MENPVKRFLETVLLFDRFFSQPQDFHFWGKTSLLSEFKSIKSIKIADKSIMCRIVPPHKNEKLLWSYTKSTILVIWTMWLAHHLVLVNTNHTLSDEQGVFSKSETKWLGWTRVSPINLCSA